jgi:RimJ/RimL family protein N-acetyltransferase
MLSQPALHADAYFEGTRLHPEIYDNIPIGPYSTAEEFVTEVIEARCQPNPGIIIFAIIDKSDNAQSTHAKVVGNLAGIIGFMNTSKQHASTEIGFAITLPAYQRTHIATHAVGLLLQYALDLPPTGLGLRRVQWQAGPESLASVGVAEKLGFRKEAFIRWQRAFPAGKDGKMGRDGECNETAKKRGRDTVLLAVCWDDWEERVREKVMALIEI